ncbi:MAG: prepilin peptidase [Alphaproteobacteria bacterium]|nr:prepilin peptidase [Alphaproteobacteria bacterium]
MIDSLVFALIPFLGLLLGSFTTALVYRVPRGMNWVSERSICTSCGRNLGVLDLVPVFSWLSSHGACRTCHAKVSARYPLIELSVAVLCIAGYSLLGGGFEGWLFIFAVPALVALFVIDFDTMTLPNVLVIFLAVLGVGRLAGLAYFGHSFQVFDLLLPYVLGAFVFCFVSWFCAFVLMRVLKKNMMGMGDVKFFAVAGLWLGLAQLPWFYVLSGLSGVLLALIWRKLGKGEVFPFGPALIFSFVVLLLWQGPILR